MMIVEKDRPIPSSRVRWHFNKARQVRMIKIMYPGEIHAACILLSLGLCLKHLFG